jgi:hypothetical protein
MSNYKLLMVAVFYGGGCLWLELPIVVVVYSNMVKLYSEGLQNYRRETAVIGQSFKNFFVTLLLFCKNKLKAFVDIYFEDKEEKFGSRLVITHKSFIALGTLLTLSATFWRAKSTLNPISFQI